MSLHAGWFAGALLLAGTSAGCTVPGSVETPGHWVGQVTTLHPQFCVGRYHAGGDCFDARPRPLTGVRVGDCARVSFGPPEKSVRRTLTALTEVSPEVDPRDCPPP
jgi:hypothetical protein